MSNKIKKVIIWGHKLFSHTHSFIHNSFFVAFKHLNFETYWFDDIDDISDFDFSDCIFLTEGQVDKRIPLRKDCYYILHNVDQEKYRNSQVDPNKVLIIQVYTKDCLKRMDEEIEKCFHYSNQENYQILYFPWATDLLPHEIEENINNLDNIESTNNIYFIGSPIHHTNYIISNFSNNHNLNYIQHGGGINNFYVDIKINQKNISESILAPAVQGDFWQV